MKRDSFSKNTQKQKLQAVEKTSSSWKKLQEPRYLTKPSSSKTTEKSKSLVDSLPKNLLPKQRVNIGPTEARKTLSSLQKSFPGKNSSSPSRFYQSYRKRRKGTEKKPLYTFLRIRENQEQNRQKVLEKKLREEIFATYQQKLEEERAAIYASIEAKFSKTPAGVIKNAVPPPIPEHLQIKSSPENLHAPEVAKANTLQKAIEVAMQQTTKSAIAEEGKNIQEEKDSENIEHPTPENIPSETNMLQENGTPLPAKTVSTSVEILTKPQPIPNRSRTSSWQTQEDTQVVPTPRWTKEKTSPKSDLQFLTQHKTLSWWIKRVTLLFLLGFTSYAAYYLLLFLLRTPAKTVSNPIEMPATSNTLIENPLPEKEETNSLQSLSETKTGSQTIKNKTGDKASQPRKAAKTQRFPNKQKTTPKNAKSSAPIVSPKPNAKTTATSPRKGKAKNPARDPFDSNLPF